MSIVGQIVSEIQFTEDIKGLPFVLRKISAETAFTVIGSKTLGLLRSGKAPAKEIASEESIRITVGYLTACMVSPRLGPKTEVEKDTVSLEDLGEFSSLILSAVFKRSGFEELGKSKVSSEDTKEET